MCTALQPPGDNTITVNKIYEYQYRQIIAVYSQLQTKNINNLCGQNGEFSTLYLMVNKCILSSQPCSILQVIIYPRVYAMYGDIFYLFPYLSIVYLMTPLVAQIRLVEWHDD